MKVGYARISTSDQNLDRQIDVLGEVGCEKVFSDVVSGAKEVRPGLDEMLAHLRDGDLVVVQKLDRLGRSLRHLIDLVAELGERGVGFKSLSDGIDTTTSTGKLLFHILGSLAEFERDLIRERTMHGLAAARKRGRVGGRPPAMDERKKKAAQKLIAAGTPRIEVAKMFNISLATLYRHVPA